MPQRQMLLRASSMSVSLGLGFSRSSATVAMMKPGWQ
jgi:hypothetical protein